MTEQGRTTPADAAEATLRRLGAMHRQVPVETVTSAWREVLWAELGLRVGSRLSEGLDDTLLDEFEQLVDAGDDNGAKAWLDGHVPDYSTVVSEELEHLITQAVAWFARRVTTPVKRTGA